MFDDLLARIRSGVQQAAKAAPRQAASRPRALPPQASARAVERSAARGPSDDGWSQLLLTSASQTTKPDGSTHHIVEPAKKKDVKPELSARDEHVEMSKTHFDKVEPTGPRAPGGRAGQGYAQVAAQRAEENKAKDQAIIDKARAEREDVLGIENKTAASITADDVKKMTKQLTAADYNAMTPKQRSAVDFNTLLSTAVQRDLSRQDDYEKGGIEKNATYLTRQKELFGEDRGSDLYAPETLAVLAKLNLEDKVADLDDYLGLKVAITEDDIRKLDGKGVNKTTELLHDMPVTLSGQKQQASDATTRDEYVNAAVNKTAELQSVLAKGNQLLETVGAAATGDRSLDADSERLGGLRDKPVNMLGYGDSGTDKIFQDAYEAMADKTSGFEPDQILAELRSAAGSDEDFQQFLSYADTRTRNAEQNKVDLGANEAGKYRSPAEFRKMLGLED